MAVAVVADLPTLQNVLPDALPQPATQDKSQQSGDIHIVGDALYVHWAFDEAKNSLDVRLKTIFGITLARTQGELNKDQVKIEGDFDVGIAKGDLILEAVWQQADGGDAPGLWLKADLTVLGKQVAAINWHLVSW